MTHENTQEFQVAAADQEADRESVPEQMTMQPIYSGLNFHVLVKHFDRVISDRLPGTQSQKHCAGSDMHKFKVLLQSYDQEVRDAHQEIAEELTASYQKYIQLLPASKQCDYRTLSETCSNYEEIKQSYANVSKYEKLISEIEAMDVDLEEQTEANYKSRVDAILMALISNYDQEELELKNQQQYFNFIIQNNGVVEAAEQQYQEYQAVQEESFNIGKQMVKWAVYDDADQTNVQVKKFGLQNTKEWFVSAIQNWALMLQETQPLDYPLTIDTWSSVSNGQDQNDQAENMKQYYNNNKFQLMYVNTSNIAAIIVLVLSIGLAFVTPYSLAATAVALGFLVFRVIKANKDYPARVNASLQLLNQSMEELADYRQFYTDSSEKKDVLLSKIEYL